MSGSSIGHPIVRLTVSASDNTDDKTLQNALVELAVQDPALRVEAQPMGIAHSLEGTSTSHLESICTRLLDEYRLAINVVRQKLSWSRRFAGLRKRKENSSARSADMVIMATASCTLSQASPVKDTCSQAQSATRRCLTSISAQSNVVCNTRCGLVIL